MGTILQFHKRTEEGRTPLFVSHINGKVEGHKHTTENFEDRIECIRESLKRINKLMTEKKGRQHYGKD